MACLELWMRRHSWLRLPQGFLLSICCTQNLSTDLELRPSNRFDTRYTNRCAFTQGSAFWESEHNIFTSSPQNLQKPNFWVHHTITQQCDQCCKGYASSQWERTNLPLAPHPHPLTDSHQILHTWLRPPYLPTCHIWSRSPQRLLLPM